MNIPALGNIAITVPPQVVNGLSIFVALFALWSGISGIIHIAHGASMISGAKGRPQKREEAVATCMDGAWGLVIGSALIAIIAMFRAAAGV